MTPIPSLAALVLLLATVHVRAAVAKTPPVAWLAAWKGNLHLDAKDQQVDLVSQRDLKIAGTKRADWTLQIEYSNQTFFDGWEFFTADDPTHGIINYVDRDEALSQGLAFWTVDGTPGIQVDHWSEKNVGEARNSVRIHSKALFAGGLFLVDLQLMPWGCGVWPAVWTLGYDGDWPFSGEIDIVVSKGFSWVTGADGPGGYPVNDKQPNDNPGCVINESTLLFSGTVKSNNCDASTGKSGCSITSPSSSSYGMPFNAAGGGVFAVLWDGNGIRMWDWTRAKIPIEVRRADSGADDCITAGSPDPSSWGLPIAAWDASTCDPYTYFQAQQLVLNINLCGDWAGKSYALYSYCPGTCAQQVADPMNLNNTVMLINSIKVYQQPATPIIQQQNLQVDNQTGVGGAVAQTGSASRLAVGPWAVSCLVAVVSSVYSLVA